MNHKLYPIVTSALLLLSQPQAEAVPFVISIGSQQAFNRMDSLLAKAVADGEADIVVDILEGVYYYSDYHLRRTGDRHPDVSIHLQGHDAVLIAAGTDYHDGDHYTTVFDPDAALVATDSLKPFDFWDYCRYAEGMVEVADEEAKLCRLPYTASPNSTTPQLPDCTHLYVNIPQWYYSSTYKVEKVEQGYLWFTVPDLKYVEREERKDYNVNYDYLFGGLSTRFRLCNPADDSHPMRIIGNEVRCSKGTVHECRAHCFLSLKDSAYKTFTLSGLHFLGNRVGINLIKLDSVQTEGFRIDSCRFEAIRNPLLWADYTPNITFSNNTIDKCYNGIYSANSCTETRVVGNTFSNCGGSMKQTFCVNCKGRNFYVAHNRFSNFGYSAIGLGVWFGHKKDFESSGIAEYNEMWYDTDYIAHKERYTLQDTGAIYLWPKNDSVTVRYNYIHDIDGMYLNTGIFCDDGASHFRLYGNVVVNVPNRWGIDSRLSESYLPDEANRDNRMEWNIVEGPIKFEGSTGDDNRCYVSGNVMLVREGDDPSENIYARLTVGQPDMQLQFKGHNHNGVVVGRQQMQELRSLPCFNNIKHLISQH